MCWTLIIGSSLALSLLFPLRYRTLFHIVFICLSVWMCIGHILLGVTLHWTRILFWKYLSCPLIWTIWGIVSYRQLENSGCFNGFVFSREQMSPTNRPGRAFHLIAEATWIFEVSVRNNFSNCPGKCGSFIKKLHFKYAFISFSSTTLSHFVKCVVRN